MSRIILEKVEKQYERLNLWRMMMGDFLRSPLFSFFKNRETRRVANQKQLTILNSQLSIINSQLSIINSQLSIIN